MKAVLALLGVALVCLTIMCVMEALEVSPPVNTGFEPAIYPEAYAPMPTVELKSIEAPKELR